MGVPILRLVGVPILRHLDNEVAALLDDPDRLAVLRDRLGDLSWYMRCLNEPIARRANLEDDCTGRFWQGRFRSKDLPGERSMWAAMAYDDLNPIRAGMADELDADEHTSLQRPAGGGRRGPRTPRRTHGAARGRGRQGRQRAAAGTKA